ncbi:hypothetical protein ACIBK8_24485 [Streptomyces sp. NPDC050161]|uniref:hypothetical protein n=1 Tax=Streptomyces sp. NPDC050161 TaxID=3365604 RepID=UPI0037B12D09
MADQEKPKEPAAEAPGRLAEEDRHGFVSAFVGGVRPDGEQGKPGKRLVAIGIAVVAALSLGALAIGALTSKGDEKNEAGKASPAGATASADQHGKRPAGHNDGPAGGTGGSSGGSGGQGAGQGTSGNNIQTQPDSTNPSPDSTGSSKTPPTSAATQKAEAHGKTYSRAATPAYTGLAGYGCPSSATAKIWTKDPSFSNGSSGWLRSSTGGYTGSGCNGQYLSVPMSGSKTSHDATQYVLWKFDYSAKIKGAASCELSVYVPGNSNIQYVGGNPAEYALYNSDHSGGTAAGTFQVDQVHNAGKWLSRGPFKVSGGKVTLKMFNTGIDYTSSTKHAHDAAAPVQLSCSPA